MTTRIESVAKAARILRTFEPERRVLTIRDIAERTGIARSTCHAICATLTDAELLEQLPGGGYRLGIGLAGMGGQVIERTGLVEASMRSMNQLSRAVGGEIHLGQLVSGWIVYLYRVEHEHRLPLRNRMGHSAPAHLTGCGKAALSCMEPRQVTELVGSRADVEMRPLLSELAMARGRGYVVSDSYQAGVVSVAAPVLDRTGKAVGGLSVAQPRGLMDERRREHVGAAVRIAARQITEQLRAPGWRG